MRMMTAAEYRSMRLERRRERLQKTGDVVLYIIGISIVPAIMVVIATGWHY